MSATDSLMVTLGVLGAQKASGEVRDFRDQMLRLRENVAQAGTMVTSFERGLDELSRTGRVSLTTIASFASQLPALVNPATAAASAIGGIVLAMRTLSDTARQQELEMLAKQTRHLADEQREQILIAKAVAGLSGEERRAAERQARIQAERIKLENDLQDTIKMSKDAVNNQLEDLNGWDAAWQGIFKTIGLGNHEVDRARKIAQGQVAQSFKATTKRLVQLETEAGVLKKGTKATEEKARAEEDLNKSYDKEILAHFQAGERMLREERERALAGLEERMMEELRLQQIMRETLEIQEQMTRATEAAGQMVESAIADTAAGAYDAYINALNKSMNVQKGLETLTVKTLKGILKATLESFGREASVRALIELAYGIAAVATGNPAAAGHFAAAATFGYAAAAAGFASSRIPSAGGGGTGAGAPTGTGAGSSGQGAGGGTVNQTVVVIGALDAQGAEDLHNQLNKARESRDLGDF